MRRAATSLILIALTLIGSGNALSEQSAGARDHLCGWYKLTAGNRLIPVFKIDGTYYTVMSRGGIEIPLKECPDGLEWPRTPPSSMAGTKIGFNEGSNLESTRTVAARLQWSLGGLVPPIAARQSSST